MLPRITINAIPTNTTNSLIALQYAAVLNRLCFSWCFTIIDNIIITAKGHAQAIKNIIKVVILPPWNRILMLLVYKPYCHAALVIASVAMEQSDAYNNALRSARSRET